MGLSVQEKKFKIDFQDDKSFDTRQKMKICYKKIFVCCQLPEEMQIHGRFFAGRPIQIIHYLMVSSACMDS